MVKNKLQDPLTCLLFFFKLNKVHKFIRTGRNMTEWFKDPQRGGLSYYCFKYLSRECWNGPEHKTTINVVLPMRGLSMLIYWNTSSGIKWKYRIKQVKWNWLTLTMLRSRGKSRCRTVSPSRYRPGSIRDSGLSGCSPEHTQNDEPCNECHVSWRNEAEDQKWSGQLPRTRSVPLNSGDIQEIVLIWLGLHRRCLYGA